MATITRHIGVQPVADSAPAVFALLDASLALRRIGLSPMCSLFMIDAADYVDIEFAVLLWTSAHAGKVEHVTHSDGKISVLRIYVDGFDVLTLHIPASIVEERERPKLSHARTDIDADQCWTPSDGAA